MLHRRADSKGTSYLAEVATLASHCHGRHAGADVVHPGKNIIRAFLERPAPRRVVHLQFRRHFSARERLGRDRAHHLIRQRVRQHHAVVCADIPSHAHAWLAAGSAIGRSAGAAGDCAVVHVHIAADARPAVSAVTRVRRAAVSADDRAVVRADVADDARAAVSAASDIGRTAIATPHGHARADVDQHAVLRAFRHLDGGRAIAAWIARAAVSALHERIAAGGNYRQHRRLAIPLSRHYHDRRLSISTW